MTAEIKDTKILEFRLFLLGAGYSDTTVYYTIRFVKDFLARKPISPAIIREYIIESKQRGLKNSTINRAIAFFKCWGRFIGDTEIINIKFLRQEQSFTKRIFHDEIIRKFLSEACPKYLGPQIHKKHQIFFKLCFYTGCRPSEISRLKPEHFDFDYWEINIENTKTYRSRKVPIAKAIREEIYEHVTSLQSGEFVCYMSPSAWEKAFKRRMERLGIKRVRGLSVYSMRHTAGTAVYKARGILAAKNLLGHTKLSTTEIYTHLDIDELHDAVNQMSYAREGLTPIEKLDFLMKEVVNKVLLDDPVFDVKVKKAEKSFSLRIVVRDI